VTAIASTLPAATRGRVVAAVLPGWIVAAAWVGLILRDGGYFALDWAPVALLLLALLAGLAIGRGSALPPPGAARTALLILAAIVLWSGLSILWADRQASAWESAGQLVLYLLMGWVLVLVPWTPKRALVLLTAWSTGVAIACLIGYVDALAASDLGARFPEYRWAGPLGYANATGALGALALPGPLLYASRRDTPPWAQAIAMGVAAFLVAFALLPQTRAALLGMPIVLLVLVAVGPDRWRLVRRVVLVGLALLLSVHAILDVDTAAQAHGPVRPAWDAAAWRILLSVSVAMAATLVLVAVEQRIRLADATRRRLRTAGIVAGCVAAVGLAGATVASAQRIADAVTTVWNDVRSGTPVRRAEGPRLLSVAPYQRSDYWRAAIDGFRSAPVNGLGAAGFEERYDLQRQDPKHSRYSHLIWLRVPAELGLVGVALLIALLVVTGRACVARIRHGSPDERRIVAIALALAAYLGFGASLDWLEEFPVLAGPVVGALALVLVAGTPAPPPRRRSAPRSAAVALVAAAVAVAIALPWLSLREQAKARTLAATDPAAAERALDRAAALDPLDPRPRAIEGFIAIEDRRYAEARTAFRRSLAVEDGWLGHFELALIDAADGREASARAGLAAAERRNHDEPIIGTVRELLDAGEPIDPVEINRRTQQEPLWRARPST